MKQRTHQSLERGLRLVELVASNGGATSLAEAARRTGCTAAPRTTCCRHW
jgi:hypothetical protein